MPERMTPLLEWPNEDSIRQEILAMVAAEAGDGHSDGKWANRSDSLNAAPTLERTIPMAIRAHRLPDRIRMMLEDEQGLVAATVLSRLPEIEREALRNLLSESQPEGQPEGQPHGEEN